MKTCANVGLGDLIRVVEVAWRLFGSCPSAKHSVGRTLLRVTVAQTHFAHHDCNVLCFHFRHELRYPGLHQREMKANPLSKQCRASCENRSDCTAQ